MANNLPQGWAECKLGDVLYLQNGFAFNSKEYSDEGTEVIRISDIQNDEVKLDNAVKYCKKEIDKSFHIQKGDFLLAMSGATTGKTGVYNEDKIVYLNQRVGNLKIYSQNVLFPEYRNYFIANKRKEIERKAYGGAQPNISKQMIEDLILLLPPINEQKRIVEKIEEEFAKIDEGIEKLKLAQEQIKQYKQSVLKSAFEGKLYKTSEWGEDNIEGITSKIVGGGTPSKNIAKYYDGDIPFMTVKDMTSFRPDDTEWHITQEAIANSSTNLIPKDTIIIATRVGLGKIVRLNFDTAINQDLKALILNNNIDKDFCEFLLQYKTPEIIFKGRGTTVKGITLEELKNINFKLPTLDEQKQIVKEIEKRFEVADKAEKVIMDNLEKAQQLKQSILKKAFEGRLVPQDPNDEPASVLLEKIKTERGK